MDRSIDKWIYPLNDRWMDGWMDQCIDGWIDQMIYKMMDRWIDRWMDRFIDQWFDGSLVHRRALLDSCCIDLCHMLIMVTLTRARAR